MEAISNSTNSEITLDEEELNRLVKFFDVLIEMSFESIKSQGGKDVRNV